MTLTLPTSCPHCTEEVRVRLVAFDVAEGRFLSYDDEALVEHVEECGVGT